MPSGYLICQWDMWDAIPPEANYPKLLARGYNDHALYEFSSTVDQNLWFEGRMPNNYDASGVAVRLLYIIPSGAGADTIVMETAFERLENEVTDPRDNNLGTAVSASNDIPTTPDGETHDIEITHTNSQLDGLLAGESFRLNVKRDADNVSDDAGVIQLARVSIFES